jgi:hypothetical protein
MVLYEMRAQPPLSKLQLSFVKSGFPDVACVSEAAGFRTLMWPCGVSVYPRRNEGLAASRGEWAQVEYDLHFSLLTNGMFIAKLHYGIRRKCH